MALGQISLCEEVRHSPEREKNGGKLIHLYKGGSNDIYQEK